MPIMPNIRRLAAAACLALSAAAPSSADIKSYNAAVLKGDFAAAADEAAATWPTLDKARPDIFVIGREFGWTAMLAKKPDITRAIVSSLSQSATTDATPEVTVVLLAWANFSSKPGNDTGKALADALTARAKTPSGELISIRAAQDLFMYEWGRDNFDDAANVAAVGHQLVSQFGEKMVDVGFAMRRNELVAKFLDNRKRNNVMALDALAEEIETRLARERDPKLRERLIGEIARTKAWGGVERNVLRLAGLAAPEWTNQDEEEDSEGWFPTPGDASISVCNLNLDLGGVRPKYPRQAAAKALPGYAIYAFDVGDDGKFKSARVLGSAPHDMFVETVDEILPSWKWKMSPRNATADCRRPTVFVVDFVFQIAMR